MVRLNSICHLTDKFKNMSKSCSFHRFLSLAKAGQVKVADNTSSKGKVDELRTQAIVLVIFNLEREVFLCLESLAVVDELLSSVYSAHAVTF